MGLAAASFPSRGDDPEGTDMDIFAIPVLVPSSLHTRAVI
jgi:hypothetical protein